MNPNGKVPVLVDQGLVMWESGAILIYLAERYDELLPHVGSKDRYEVMKWLMWGSGTLSTEVKQFGFYYKVSTERSRTLSFNNSSTLRYKHLTLSSLSVVPFCHSSIVLHQGRAVSLAAFRRAREETHGGSRAPAGSKPPTQPLDLRQYVYDC